METVNVYVKNLPAYSVIFWAGNTAGNFDPTGRGTGGMDGWALCNGANGTPDLSGQFLQAGASPQTVGSYPYGGQGSVTLTPQQVPQLAWSGNHAHGSTGLSATDSGHAHNWTRPTMEGAPDHGERYCDNLAAMGKDVGLWTIATGSKAAGQTTNGTANIRIAGTVDQATLNVTVGQSNPLAVPTVPPYVELVCIMKLP